jgi:hypothetical protein
MLIMNARELEKLQTSPRKAAAQRTPELAVR